LAKFVENGQFDYKTFADVVALWTVVLDVSITMAQFPTKSIALNSYAFRPLGLGFCNLGYLLSLLKLPYSGDSNTLDLVSKISATMTGSAYLMSSKMAYTVGFFREYPKNQKSIALVLSQHREKLDEHSTNKNEWHQFVVDLWDNVIESNRLYGVRNAQTTCIAPTGTIGFVMGAATTGIEPEFSYKTWKKVMDGSWMELPSSTFEQYLDNFLNESDKNLILETMAKHNNSLVETLKAIGHHHFTKTYGDQMIDKLLSHIKVANSPDTQTAITPHDHIKIMAACQPFISGAISKTIYLANTATLSDIKKVYIEAFYKGLKGVTIYRDGCKGSQPLNLSKNGSSGQMINKLKENAQLELTGSFTNAYGQVMVKVTCPNCQSTAMKPNGTCSVCLNCGATTGCS
jgi:ribonucleoside-diphosphate reductase alpha chain